MSNGSVSDVMEIYLDDAGAIAASNPFVIGMFFTWRGDMWRGIVRDRRTSFGYPCEMHFAKISRNESDRRYRFIRLVFELLARYDKTWYFRAMHVPQHKLSIWKQEHGSVREVFDYIVDQATERFLRGVPERCARLVIDSHSRARGDSYIPTGLQTYLNIIAPIYNAPSVSVRMADSRDEPLLQIADCLTGALRQTFYPSENPNKLALAAFYRKRLAQRCSVWEYV